MDTNEDREGTRMNGREKGTKSTKNLVRSIRFAIQETHKR